MWNPARFSHAVLGLYQVQLALMTSLVHASLDAGATASDDPIGALQTQLTTTAAATRPSMDGGTAAGTASRGQTIWYRVLPN